MNRDALVALVAKALHKGAYPGHEDCECLSPMSRRQAEVAVDIVLAAISESLVK